MKIVANSIRQGNVLVYRDDLWIVSKTPEHTKPGKGPAYIQVEMKNRNNLSKPPLGLLGTINNVSDNN
jgi:translation elongation factor P/translation initiation factor 5A